MIRGGEKGQRIEFRIGSADANPYLVAAANLGAGLIGIRDGIEPTAPIQGNADEQEGQAESLASNLRDATRELEQCVAAREILGDAFVDHFVASRDWEVREYERAVNDWQLRRYFEII